MLKFKFLLWAFAQILKRKIRSNADCARYVANLQPSKRVSPYDRTAF
ncbi:hypothetical protein [Ideonella oryzae]|uniref:Uncharacterized protein n=1 Tax=Ideonella oryzae TaxID=2937441 RepID=A0ABT1BG95_9BURK|nr:hypothetical protein [Ideonella oryzae]MCO5975255.1 hypothetical protein [Ideonella oryzae]